MAEGTVQFSHIYIASRGGVNQGPLKVSPGGMAWRSSGGGKVIEIKKENIEGLFWTKNSRVCQLGVRTKDAPTTNFLGFREKDLDTLRDICQNQLGQEIKDLPMSIAGHNWGALAINNGSLMFTVDQRVALELPLRDVSQAQQAKDDVMMEFHTDDTVMDNNTDVLCEISFHVPQTNDIFQSEDIPAAKNLLDQVLKHTDAGATSTDDAVCSFPDVAILNPRGRFEVEMHLSSLNLVGQTQDFKIRYSSVQRLFILPKSNTPHTLVVVSMDPPIRKGQTYYTHVLCQFPSDDRVEDVELDITPEQLAAKNEKCNNKLEAKLSGPLHDVFARALRGLSGAKISRAGAFRNATNEPAIRCAYKSDDGHLYPLDRAFFYVHKPPMLLPFEEVDGVEFARQGGGVVSSRTFDLVVRMKNDTEHQFRNISRTEWQSLFDFINAKKLRIENLDSAAQGPGGPQRGLQVDDDIDPGMRYAEAEIETEEDDEDFALGASDGSGSDDDASGLSGEGSEDSGDAEMVAEEGISVAAVTKGKRRGGGGTAGGDTGPSGSSPPAKRGKRSKGDGGGDDDGKPEKKKRAKKDPNAPKKGLSGFMFFSSANREKVKEDNPGIGFGEIGKVLGERWKAMSAEEKQPYEDKAAQDKERYASEIAAYKGNDAKPIKKEEDDFIADDDEAED